MPTYEYRCTECSHRFEELQSISAEPLMVCPNCGKSSLKRALGGGSGMIFKGSGFYKTDYKSSGDKKSGGDRKSGDDRKSDTATKESSESTTTSKPDAKEGSGTTKTSE